jgi:hypothetical protein
MSESSLPPATTKRREFLGSLAAGAVALGLTGSVPRAFAAEPRVGADIVPSDKWLTQIKGKHRQFFDMPNHQNGIALRSTDRDSSRFFDLRPAAAGCRLHPVQQRI